MGKNRGSKRSGQRKKRSVSASASQLEDTSASASSASQLDDKSASAAQPPDDKSASPAQPDDKLASPVTLASAAQPPDDKLASPVTLASAAQPGDKSASAAQPPDDKSASAAQPPDDKSASAAQPDDKSASPATSASAAQPDDKSASPATSASAAQPDDKSASPAQPDDKSASLTQLDDKSASPAQLDDISATAASVSQLDDTSASASQIDDIVQLSISQLENIIPSSSSCSIEDIITTDDVLSSILSSLTFKEAVRTSVLSPRWKNTWTRLPKLKFDDATILDPHTVSLVSPHGNTLTVDQKFELLVQKTDHFVRSVDSVLQQHQESAIGEYFLRYFLHKAHSQHLDEWVRLVVALKVEILALHLHEPFTAEYHHDKRRNDIEQYDFPCQLLGSSSPLEELTLSSCSLKPPSTFNGLTHLKTLSLFDVHVADDDINRLLSNCYTLQNLSVKQSERLVTLSTPHPLSQLQILTVMNCPQLEKIDINAVNITQLHYEGYPVDFIFPHSSRLSYAKLCYITFDLYEHSLDLFLNKLSSSLPHLEYLDLRIVCFRFKVADLPLSSRFSCLKRFKCQWNTDSKMTLLHLATLLEAAPFLELLQLQFMTSRLGEQAPRSLGKLRKKLPEHHHANLKTVRFGNFCWDKWQIEIAVYLLKNAIELQSMMIKHEEDREILKEVPEMDVENLRELVPPNVNFFTV